MIFENYIHSNKIGIDCWETNEITISNNIIKNNDYGIYNLDVVSKYIIDKNTIIENSILGISMWVANEISITNNIIENNGEGSFWNGGIYIPYSDSENNYIVNNYVSNNHEHGIRIETGDFELIGNTLINNGYGIYIVGHNEYIKNNIISKNTIGILLQVYNSQITDNYISENKEYGIYCYGRDSVITRNNFINNSRNVYFEYFFSFLSILRKNSINKFDANYWSDQKVSNFYFIPGKIYFLIIFSIPWLILDRNPSSEPYDL
jgi:parallel beta-helix repeat protein